MSGLRRHCVPRFWLVIIVSVPSELATRWFDQIQIDDIEPKELQHSLRVGYYGAVSYYDFHLGKLLDALDESGQADNTAILMTGDHGEE